MYGMPPQGVPPQGMPPQGMPRKACRRRVSRRKACRRKDFPPYGGYPPQGQPGRISAARSRRRGTRASRSPTVPTPVDPSAPYGRDPLTGEPLSDKSAITAGLLQFFLGGLGVGRFYIGSTNIGAIQLGLTILGIITSWLIVGIFICVGVGIWALVDAVMMFTRSIPDQYGRKLRN